MRVIAVTSLPQKDEDELARAVKKYLSDRSPRVRAAALGVIGKARLHKTEGQVLKLLSDRSDTVRYAAVECIGALHEGQAVQAEWLYPLLDDSDALVRMETLESLVRIGDKQALTLLVKKLEDTDPLVRAYAAWAIAQFDGKEYLSAIKGALKTEKDEIAEVGFADALFTLGDENQFSVLLGFLSSADYRVRCTAAYALSSAELNEGQLRSAVTAVAYASKHALFRGDRTTMEQVEKDLSEREKDT